MDLDLIAIKKMILSVVGPLMVASLFFKLAPSLVVLFIRRWTGALYTIYPIEDQEEKEQSLEEKQNDKMQRKSKKPSRKGPEAVKIVHCLANLQDNLDLSFDRFSEMDISTDIVIVLSGAITALFVLAMSHVPRVSPLFENYSSLVACLWVAFVSMRVLFGRIMSQKDYIVRAVSFVLCFIVALFMQFQWIWPGFWLWPKAHDVTVGLFSAISSSAFVMLIAPSMVNGGRLFYLVLIGGSDFNPRGDRETSPLDKAVSKFGKIVRVLVLIMLLLSPALFTVPVSSVFVKDRDTVIPLELYHEETTLETQPKLDELFNKPNIEEEEMAVVEPIDWTRAIDYQLSDQLIMEYHSAKSFVIVILLVLSFIQLRAHIQSYLITEAMLIGGMAEEPQNQTRKLLEFMQGYVVLSIKKGLSILSGEVASMSLLTSLLLFSDFFSRRVYGVIPMDGFFEDWVVYYSHLLLYFTQSTAVLMIIAMVFGRLAGIISFISQSSS